MCTGFNEKNKYVRKFVTYATSLIKNYDESSVGKNNVRQKVKCSIILVLKGDTMYIRLQLMPTSLWNDLLFKHLVTFSPNSDQVYFYQNRITFRGAASLLKNPCHTRHKRFLEKLKIVQI